MRNLTATLCLTIAVLLGSAGVGWSADFQKGKTAYESRDYATALREWKPLAKQGDARAQYNLGRMYANGQGVPQNYKIAVKWWKLAAEQGNGAARRGLDFAERKVAFAKRMAAQRQKIEAMKAARRASQGDLLARQRARDKEAARIRAAKKASQGDLLARQRARDKEAARIRAAKKAARRARQRDKEEADLQRWRASRAREAKEEATKKAARRARQAARRARQAAEEEAKQLRIRQRRAAEAARAAEEAKRAAAEAMKPKNQLATRYEQYLTLKGCHQLSTLYIDAPKFKTVKSAIREIETYYKSVDKKMDTDAIWENANKKFEKVRRYFQIMQAVGNYDKKINGMCRLQYMSITSFRIPGQKNKGRKKDF